MPTPTLLNRIVRKMAPHVRSEAEQRALLDSALYGFTSVRSKIAIGQSADLFATACATKLLEHGRLGDGTHPLSRVLTTLRDSLGFDPEWDVLIAEIEAPIVATSPSPTGELPSQTVIRDVLIGRFSQDELHTMTFDLGIDHEAIPGRSKPEFARELVAYCARRGWLTKLVSAIRNARSGAL